MKKNFRLLSFFFLLFFFSACITSNSVNDFKREQIIHKAHLSLDWYPQDKRILNLVLDQYFNIAKQAFDVSVNPDSIKAIISPHAGIHFSGCKCLSASFGKHEDEK
jgi:hypothetical protein